jgi:hypothetical protein
MQSGVKGIKELPSYSIEIFHFNIIVRSRYCVKVNENGHCASCFHDVTLPNTFEMNLYHFQRYTLDTLHKHGIIHYSLRPVFVLFFPCFNMPCTYS